MKPLSFAVFVLAACAVSLPARADSLGDKLGTIHFAVAGNDEARAHVVRGVKLIHHMMYLEADREFAAAVTADPTCALAHWGRAMAIVHPLWPDTPTDADRKKGLEFVEAGLAHAGGDARTRAYLEAMRSYFHDEAKRDEPARLRALDEAWGRVAEQYPEDMDAAAFSALFHLAPARFMPKDKSHRIQLDAVGTISKVLAKIPDHPGALHYKIHAYDFPLLAGRALEVCDTYGAIAPDVPHALHMPTHIFTRRGLWEKSIEFNRRSAEAARTLDEGAGATYTHRPHALDYLAYAYLQRGQYGEADAVRRQVLAMKGPFAGNPAATAFAFAAIPARYALERHDWAAAAQLEPRTPEAFPWDDRFLHCDAMVHFASALGAARSGNAETARRHIAELERLQPKIAARPSAYWTSQIETQLLASRAWLKLSEGDKDGALALMRRAAELEMTAEKEAVTPGEVLPAGELLGDMLCEVGLHREAMAAYETMLESSPNRLNSLLGAGRAAEEAKEINAAVHFYAMALDVAADADPENKRLQAAKAFVASHPEIRPD